MSQWFTTFSMRRPEAPIQLLCLPSSGGGASLYRPWLDRLTYAELHAAMLPGRERRLAEPPMDSMAQLIRALVPEVAKLAGRPYALFGHSMGALVAFELTRALAAHNHPLPVRLFVSAYRSPERPRRMRNLHHLPHDEFVDALRMYGGTPEAVLQHQETMELLLPMIRADFKLHEAHQFQTEPPVDVPITAFCGRSDHIVPPQELEGWNAHTRSDFALHSYPGAHFFIHDSRDAVIAQIEKDLKHDLVMA